MEEEMASVVNGTDYSMLFDAGVANEPREASLGREYELDEVRLHSHDI